MLVIQTPPRPLASFVPVQRPQGAIQVQPATGPSPEACACAGEPAAAPTHEQISQCAYDIYLEHGRAEGRSQQNWQQAEEELAQTPRASWPGNHSLAKA